MTQHAVVQEAHKKMAAAIESCKKELSTLRTGRATPAIFDNVKASCYGSPMPLHQLATISVPEPRLIIIQPWDKGTLKDIEKAIQASDLGLMPANDGNVIRIAIPALTEERRKDLIKVVKKVCEACRVAIRNARHEANNKLKALEKEHKITEDDHKRLTTEVQKATDEKVKEVDGIATEKEDDLMKF